MGIADEGWSGVDKVTNANGRWPFSASGMPTTQHSAIDGCEEMACSIEPGKWLDTFSNLQGGIITSAKSMRGDVDDIV